jgi:hypothetical protein
MGQLFPNPPQAGVPVWQWNGTAWIPVPDSGAVHFDRPQTLMANEQAQARSNIGVTKKNYIINGGMMVSQQNGVTAGSGTNYYAVDMFSSLQTGGTYSYQQVASATPAGSPNRLRMTVTSGLGSVAAGDYLILTQRLEGFKVADLRLGSAQAKTITVQFGWKSPAGNFSFAFQNYATNRNYIVPFSVAAGEANTDVLRSFTIALDQTGTWPVDNTGAVILTWCIYAGTTYQGAANVWQAGNLFMNTGGGGILLNTSVVELFDVGIYEGAVAPPFQVPDYLQELQQCQRYWLPITVLWYMWAGDLNAYALSYNFPVFMRTSPSIDSSGIAASGNLGGYPTYSASFNYLQCTVAGATAGRIVTLNGVAKLSCRL